jgi:hypothetical protein
VKKFQNQKQKKVKKKMLNLHETIWLTEANSVAEMRRELDAIRTPIPKAIALIKATLEDNGEYELYEFLENCEFYEVRNKNAPGWYQTAGVRPSVDVIEFYYDKDFVNKLAKTPGKLIFLIAHEAMHIFRFHEDRQLSAKKKNHKLYNISADAFINNAIMKTNKIGAWKPSFIEKGIKIPKEFLEKFPDEKYHYTEKLYDFLDKNPETLKINPPEIEVGSIVKVNKGPDKGEYRKVIGINKDGTFLTEPVDIEKEKEKVRGQ